MKRIISVLCAIVLMSVLTACGSNADSGWTAIGDGTVPSFGTGSGNTESESEIPAVLDEVAFSNGVAVFDMTPYSSEKTALRNPDKGWYIHYYDNGLERYGENLTAEDALALIPCLDHIYLRLAWAYLEPEEGKFNWEVIDKIIEPYAAAGVGISFRITCKETDAKMRYSIPQWVQIAGAKGTDLDNAWEPDYGDSVFLEKLGNFHKAFAARYANKDYVRYIDVGSYGDWGEGHTTFGTKKDWEWSVIKKHFDIYDKYYKSNLIVVSDDFIGSRNTSEGKAEMQKYILDHGWTYRDDSICVDWFADTIGGDTVRSPELFEAVWRSVPVVLELEHYAATVANNNWQNGVNFLAAAVNTHATYAGFHGHPKQWVNDNPQFAVTMGNKLGYWYFVDKVTVSENKVSIDWQNKGACKAYNKYSLDIIFTDESGQDTVFAAADFDNTTIMPNEKKTTEHLVDIKSLVSGKYTVSIRMHKGDTPVYLAVNKGHTGTDGRCVLGILTV